MAEHDLRYFIRRTQHHRLPDLNSPDAGGVALRRPGAFRRAAGLHSIYFTLRRIPGVGWLFYVDSVVWVFLLLLAALVLRDGLRPPCCMFFSARWASACSPQER
ncbi:MAG: hypothetical protein ACLS7Z_10185 [Christensenellales bacterium]